MRFKASLLPTRTFEKLVASLNLLGNVAWIRLNDNEIRFTIIPEQGSQVWAVLAIDTIFDSDTYMIQSATESNTINLEVPLAPLLRALKSTSTAHSAHIRLTKKDDQPSLCVTIVTLLTRHRSDYLSHRDRTSTGPNNETDRSRALNNNNPSSTSANGPYGPPHNDQTSVLDAADILQDPDSETTISQSIPLRVLPPVSVANLHEPRCREPDVHIMLPGLQQLKAVTERYIKLASLSSSSSSSGTSTLSNDVSTTGLRRPRNTTNPASNSTTPNQKIRLDLSATMHGSLRLSLVTPNCKISTTWKNLINPALDPSEIEDGVEGISRHPSTKMRERGPDAWATVRVDGRDWARVLGVGRIGGGSSGGGGGGAGGVGSGGGAFGGSGGGSGGDDGGLRVVACFCDKFALVLYVYIGGEEGENVLTYYISSFSS